MVLMMIMQTPIRRRITSSCRHYYCCFCRCVSLLQTDHPVRTQNGVHRAQRLPLLPPAAVLSEQGSRPTYSTASTTSAITTAGHVQPAHGATISTVSPQSAAVVTRGPRARPKAPEQIEERLPEATAHEAVGDGVAARRRVRQQLEEADGRVAQVVVDGARPEQGHRVDHVQRRPADEKLQHHHEQHFDDAFFVR